MNIDTIKEALKSVNYPGFSRDIVSFGLVRNIAFEAGKAIVNVEVTTADANVPTQLKANIEAAVSGVDGVTAVEADIKVSAPKGAGPAAAATDGGQRGIPGVRYVVAVASGKGGVGKSTFAANLACAFERLLASRGKPGRVGIMDCDIHGPSIPLMMGLNGRPEISGEKILPMQNFGVRVMSMGFFIDDETPVVWRGPMVTKAIIQFAQNVEWGELEILVVDLPPGTGDAHLSLAQTIPLDGAIIVTTPQAAAVNVAQRGAQMFGKVNVPLLGVAENMSWLEQGGERTYLFGKGGGAAAAHSLHTGLLGQIPLFQEIREGGDRGIPVVIGLPDSAPARAFGTIAESVVRSLNNAKA